MTYYNFKSIFAWNIILYTGFMAVVLVYLFTMMERKMNAYSKPVGVFAFVWRLILTTGTGSIFGFWWRARPTIRPCWRRCSSCCRSCSARRSTSRADLRLPGRRPPAG